MDRTIHQSQITIHEHRRPRQALALPLGVNTNESSPTSVLRPEIADEPGLRSDLDVAGIAPAFVVNEHRANRRRIRIANWQFLETVVSHQLVASLLGQLRLGIG